MLNIILLIVVSYILSLILNKDIEDIIPVFVAFILITLYGVAILGQAHHSYLMTLALFVLIYGVFVFKNKRLFPSLTDVRKTLFSTEHIGFWIYIVTIAVMFYCLSNHVVNVWDDFHYNATFPKNMFYFGTMPYGYQSTTGYKDYFPTQQLFFYWGFQGARSFSESMMFQYKFFLIYTFMLPLYKQINRGTLVKRICAAIVSVVLPFMCMYELLDSLSMDCVLALIFANAIVNIWKLTDTVNSERWFTYIAVEVLLVALVLYKSYALVFACIAIGIWFVREVRTPERRGIIVLLAESTLTFMAYLSWRIYCSTHGNTTYLSNILMDNIKSGNGVVLPDYGKDTLVAILRSLATLRLNFGGLGFTVLAGIIVYIIVAVTLKLENRYTIRDFLSDLVFLLGFLGFVLFLMYTYLFIFEEWEALSLSSLDRYLGTYVTVMLFISALRLVSIVPEKTCLVVSFATIAMLSLNYKELWTAFVPSEYTSARESIISERNAVKDEISGIDIGSMGTGGVALVTEETDTLYMRAMQYEVIPVYAYQYDITENMDDPSGGLKYLLDDRGLSFVYFTEKLKNAYGWHELSMLNNGEEVEPGTLYLYDRENGCINKY